MADAVAGVVVRVVCGVCYEREVVLVAVELNFLARHFQHWAHYPTLAFFHAREAAEASAADKVEEEGFGSVVGVVGYGY